MLRHPGIIRSKAEKKIYWKIKLTVLSPFVRIPNQPEISTNKLTAQMAVCSKSIRVMVGIGAE